MDELEKGKTSYKLSRDDQKTERKSIGCKGWKKFMLLLWKNWKIQMRHPAQTVLETVLPLIFCTILVIVRSLAEVVPYPETRWGPFNITKLPNIPKNDFGIPIPGFVPWPFAYAPNNTAVSEIMDSVANKLNLRVDKAFGFANEADMVTYIMDTYNSVTGPTTDFLGGVVFTNAFPEPNKLPDSVSLKFRFRGKLRHETSFSFVLTWVTELLFDPFSLPGPRNKEDTDGGFPGYYREGFLTLQHAVSSAIIEKSSGFNTSAINVDMQRLPYPAYMEDYFVLVLQDWLGIILMLGFIYPVMNNVRNICNEKEARLKESMKMMGLPGWLHWTAWYTKFLLFFLAMIILMTVLQKVPWYGNGISVVNKTDGTVLFFFYFIFSCSTISACFLISTFFKTGSNAALGAGIIWFLLFAPSYFLQYEYKNMNRETKFGICLVLNTAMALAMQILSSFESTGAGVQWSTFFTPPSADDNFSFGDATVMVAVDGAICLLLALYIEALFPGEFGVPKKWYFPFTKSFWCGSGRKGSYIEMDSIASSVVELSEEEPKDRTAGVMLSGLTKIYSKNKRAVNGVSLNMYEGQITALLGHNGAGKTTTMSMLTGLYPPTSGTAYVNGYDIRTDIDSVRSSLGLCPQHDVLFKDLTVEEHLEFFCKLKGLAGKEVPREINRILHMLRLEDKRYALAKTLSGGMKRKLSVGIALCADSKVVMLDEPTSGMDPSSRRAIWDLLEKEKRGRTILLTTHFMDEADFLGDRIAIMASGEIQCVGSSLYLKKNYGGGYHLTIVKDPECKVEDVTTLLKSHVPNVQIDQNVGAELSYTLPGEHSQAFEKMFQELDSKKEGLGISSYGVSITTMEEVFFKALQQSEDKKEKQQNGEVAKTDDHATTSSGFDPSSDKRNVGIRLYLQQLRGMLVKKILFTIRNWTLVVTQLIVPLLVVVIALVVIGLIPGLSDSPAREMSLSSYRGTTTLVQVANDTSSMDFMNTFKNLTLFGRSDKVTEVHGESVEDYFLRKAKSDILETMQHYIAGADVSTAPNGTLQVRALFNNQPIHTASLSLNLVHNAIYQHVTKNSNKLITVTNAPLPLDAKTKFNQRTQTSGVGFAIGYNVAFGHAFLASSFVIFLVKERSANSKHLQFVSGVSLFTYWGANWIWDMISYILPCVGILITFLIFGTEGYIEATQQARMFLVFLMYGWAVLPLVYLFSFLYKVPASAFTKIAMFFIFTGMATFIIVVVLSIPDLGLVDVSVILDWVFLLLPNYSLGMAFSNLYNNDLSNQYCLNAQVQQACQLAEIFENLFPNVNITNPFANGCCRGTCGNYRCLPWTTDYFGFEGYGIGRMLTFLAIDGFVFTLLLLLIEFKVFRSFSWRSGVKDVDIEGRPTEDPDVGTEKRYIIEHTSDAAKWRKLTEANTLIARELTKIYPGGFLAVDGLSFGVRRGECFGLLGINGAGKTTTFKMLTGDEAVTSGDAFLETFSVRTSIKKVQRRLGYCPQFDAVIEEMTGRETLRMFARLRGVPESSTDSMIKDLSSRLLFKEHIDKQVREMSGGNRRKLSTAVALVGDPPIIFLDEPTTGMDPVARRHLWNVMTDLRNSGKSIVLTSHSMEECEALCTRIAIMVNGTFRCMGSVQHLKSRFGQGYTLTAKMKRGQSVNEFKEFIEKTFPGSVLKETHQNLVEYNIPESLAGWSSVFGVVETAKERFNIEDYSIGQTTLEQIFLRFAKDQKPED